MPSFSVVGLMQVIVAAGLLNVWLVRAKTATNYRGGAARSLKEEFDAYGLPEGAFFVVGALKIGAALALLAGLWYPGLVQPAAAIVALLMVGALAMHVKAKDPLMKSLPALAMLALSIGILLL